MFLNYFLVAVRNLAKHSTFSSIKLGGLAISMASFVFIFYFIHDELTFDHSHQNSKRIFRITQTFITPEGTQNLRFTHQKIGPFLKEGYSQVENFVRFEGGNARLGKERFPEVGIVHADASVLDIFSFPLVAGDSETALSKPSSVILSESLAKKYFTTDALGKLIEIDGVSHEVTGIMQDPPENSDKLIRALVSSDFDSQEGEQLSFVYDTYVLLHSPDDAAYIRSQIPSIAEGLHKQVGQEVQMGYDMQGLRDLHFHTGIEMDNPKGNRRNVPIFGIVAIVLLIVSVINFINLTIVRSFERAREVGIRKMTGAQGRQLVIQFMSESFLTALLSSVFALFFIALMNSAYFGISGKQLDFSNENDLIVIAGIVLFLIALVGISSFYPAWILTRYSPASVLKGKFVATTKGSFLRNLFTIGQFALSTGLLLFLTTILFQMDFMRTKDLGFVSDQILVVKAPEDSVTAQNIGYYKSELGKHKSISQVSVGGFASNLGTTDPYASPVFVNRKGVERQMIIPTITVDKDYPSVLQLRMKAGKSFGDFEGASVKGKVLVNEAFVKQSGMQSPIGEAVRTYSGEGTIVGVVSDFHFRSLHSAIEPMVLMGMDEGNPDARYFFLRISPSNITEVKSVLQKVFPSNDLEYFFLNEFYDAQYKSDNDLQLLFVYFTLLTIAVSISGLLGMVLYRVSVRTREIGIRRVLGAGVLNLVRLLSVDFLRITFAGSVLGVLAGSFFADQWLEGFAYRIDLHWTIFALPVCVIVVVSGLVILGRTYRGAVMNPVDVLKSE
jgi:putative ABC transport system permease protein